MSKFSVRTLAMALVFSLVMALAMMAGPVALAEATEETVVEEEVVAVEEEVVAVETVEVVPVTGDFTNNMAIAAIASVIVACAAAAFVAKKSN